jgi:hypothetical protein
MSPALRKFKSTRNSRDSEESFISRRVWLEAGERSTWGFDKPRETKHLEARGGHLDFWGRPSYTPAQTGIERKSRGMKGD